MTKKRDVKDPSQNQDVLFVTVRCGPSAATNWELRLLSGAICFEELISDQALSKSEITPQKLLSRRRIHFHETYQTKI